MVLPCRIACLRIPRFQIVAHQKAEPALKAKPLVLLRGSGYRREVIHCSKEAALQKIYPGMRFAEAKAACADIQWREYDEQLYTKLQTEIVQRLVLASPQISGLDCGTFLLDATGLTHLGGEGQFCRHVQRLVNTTGFVDMHIGIADTAFAAQIASKFKRSRHFIVPPGGDKEFLATLSTQHMPISKEMQETFMRLGIKTIGQLLEIPVDEIQERFGREGLLAVDLAGGIDNTQAQTVQTEEVYESEIDLNFPVDSLNQTQFILKSMLERICSKLKANGLQAEELLISFYNDNDKFNVRPLKLLRPSNNSKFLLELIKLSLEATPLIREYTGLHIRVNQSSHENWQQNKMRIVESHPPKVVQLRGIQNTIQFSLFSAEPSVATPASRLQDMALVSDSGLIHQSLSQVSTLEDSVFSRDSVFSQDSVCSQDPFLPQEYEFPQEFPFAQDAIIPLLQEKGAPKNTLERSNYANTTLLAECNNSETQNEPLSLLLQRFITRLGTKSVVRPVANDQHIPEESARFLPLLEDAETVLPINISFANADPSASALACGLVLRKSASPEPVLVEYQGKTPTSITYQGRWHKIKELTEPERLSGLWWENPVRKSYYVALIEACNERTRGTHSNQEKNKSGQALLTCNSYLVLLVHDHGNNSWHLDGFFD